MIIPEKSESALPASDIPTEKAADPSTLISSNQDEESVDSPILTTSYLGDLLPTE